MNRCDFSFTQIHLSFTLLSLKQNNQDSGSRERKEYASEASLTNKRCSYDIHLAWHTGDLSIPLASVKYFFSESGSAFSSKDQMSHRISR